MKSTCAIVIPIYKDSMSPLEIISLKQCLAVLADYDIIMIKPENLSINSKHINSSLLSKAITFDDHFFRSVQDYNNLMLSADFYHKFLNYEFILIYQLDAFIFKNELSKWCKAGYDYIGAPWLREKDFTSSFKAAKERVRSFFHKRYNIKGKNGLMDAERQLSNSVGNGGLSLRRVQKFYALCNKEITLINTYKNKKTSCFNEDIFWSIEVNRKNKQLKIPTSIKALKFSIETAPHRAMKITNHELPFGCHAWDKNLDFWRPYFKTIGYTI